MDFKLIFRKVADVKKEKELAEKRKNDPPLELANDHPVRKLISRFRKISDTRSHPSSDIERGGSLLSAEQSGNHSSETHKAARVINVSENSSIQINTVQKGDNGNVKWTKLISGADTGKSTPPTAGAANDNNQNKISMNDLSGKKTETKLSETPKMSVKPLSKWGRLLAKSQEPIEEAPEGNVKSNLKKNDSTDSGILRSNNRLDQIDEEQNGSTTNRDSAVSAGGVLSAAEQHMLTSLYDIRLEIKEEMDNMCQKINRIDNQISEILRFFSPSSTPCSSISAQTSSKLISPENTAPNNNLVQSPTKLRASSPLQGTLGSKFPIRSSCIVSGDSSPLKAGSETHSAIPGTPYTERQDVSTSPSSTSFTSSSNNYSRRSSKSSSSSQDGGNAGPYQTRVYTSLTDDHCELTADDENVHIKDRDLDIL